MRKWHALLLVIVVGLPVFLACNKTSSQKNAKTNEDSKQLGYVCVICDSARPILLQPDMSLMESILKPFNISPVYIDLSGQNYARIKEIVNIDAYSGMIVCLPYDFNLDIFLKEAMSSGIAILQFGGNYYSNDISASINYEHVGYLVGKSIGETFVKKGNSEPLIGFYSSEQEWITTEEGFIKGLCETTPEARIIRRRIVSMNGEKVYASGEDNDATLDGVCVFFCDAGSKDIIYSQDIIQANASIGLKSVRADNIIISLIIEDNGVSADALTQFAQIIHGNRTTKTGLIYNANLEFAF